MQIESIRNDPDWANGDYEQQPWRYTLAPSGALFIQSVVRIQDAAPTREAADALYRQMVERGSKGDANDRLYQLESSMDYDPAPGLSRLQAPVVAINFADDALNPPELGIAGRLIEALPRGRFVLVAATTSRRSPSRRASSTGMPAAGRPRAVSSTCVVSRPLIASSSG
jgi:homoserine O-acetyltransferase